MDSSRGYWVGISNLNPKKINMYQSFDTLGTLRPSAVSSLVLLGPEKGWGGCLPLDCK